MAISGFTSDGNRFIPMAVEKGAAVVVTAKRPETDVPYVLVESDRLALAMIGCNFYGRPAEHMTMIGITGTNGKTSSTLLLKAVLEKTLGARVGLIGTMENRIGQETIPTERTTPESLELQKLFARMRDAGCTHVVMEVSSHAIILERIGGIRYDVAAFTNLTEDHLDFHKTMDAYCDAKAELFRRCGRAVINMDDSYAERIRENAACPVLETSVLRPAGLYARDVDYEADGISFTAVCGEERAEIAVPIPGRFTVYNALTVLGIAKSLGISLKAAAGALRDAEGVRGRIEVVPTPGMPYTVLVDYAHTPDALTNVLNSIHEVLEGKGRIITVVGAGGNRDKGKRPVMAKEAARLSDQVILTSDNPRFEEPDAIIQDMVAGLTKADLERTLCITDRAQAIKTATMLAKRGDVILVAGKGHEDYQEVKGVKHHFDDREQLRKLFHQA